MKRTEATDSYLTEAISLSVDGRGERFPLDGGAVVRIEIRCKLSTSALFNKNNAETALLRAVRVTKT